MDRYFFIKFILDKKLYIYAVYEGSITFSVL